MARRKHRRNRVRKSPQASGNGITQTATTADQLEQIILGGRAQTASGARVTPETAMGVAAVFACVRVLAESIAMLPLRLYDTRSKVPVISEGFLDDLTAFAPNPMQTPFDFKRFAVICLLLRGNFYARKWAIGTRVGRLMPLHPDDMTPKLDPTTGMLVYEHRPAGANSLEILRQEDVLHIRALSTDGIKGLSVIQAAKEAIGVGMSAEKHGATLFSNGAQVGQVLEHPGQLSPDATTRLRESFEDRYSGADNAHKTVVLEEGMKLSRIGMTSEEVQFIESRKFQRSEIAMFFGVPPHMIGDVERGTSWGSGIEQQGIGFVTYTLRPWLVNMTQAMGRDLLSPLERRKRAFAFDTDDLTKADFKTRQEGLQIQRNAGVITAEQWATREGQEYDPAAEPAAPPAKAPAEAPANDDVAASRPQLELVS